MPYAIFSTMLRAAESGGALDTTDVLLVLGYAVAAALSLVPAGYVMNRALYAGRSPAAAAARGLKVFFVVYGLFLLSFVLAAPFATATFADVYEVVVGLGLPPLGVGVILARAAAAAAHRRLAFRGRPLLRYSERLNVLAVDDVEDSVIHVGGAAAVATVVAAALRAPLPAVAAVAAGGAAAVALVARRLREVRGFWETHATDLADSLKYLAAAFLYFKRHLVLEGKMSDWALQLYYMLEQARVVERFLVDPAHRMDADELERALREEGPERLARWVDERVLEHVGRTLQFVDPQGLRIYRAPDGRFHVAAGLAVDLPIPEPRAAAGVLEDVIAYLRAEIERETGRPYRPLVLPAYMPYTSWRARYYTVDAVGLEEEMAEDADLLANMVAAIWAFLGRVPGRVFGELVELARKAARAERERRAQGQPLPAAPRPRKKLGGAAPPGGVN